MARRKIRGRARAERRTVNGSTMTLNASSVPRALLGAVDGVGIVAVGTLQFARDVLLTAVSGAASIGAEALTATVAGTRGVVSAASQTVADIAVTAQSTVLAVIDNARHARRDVARRGPGRRSIPTSGDAEPKVTSMDGSRGRRRGRRARAVSRPARPSVAA
jgi:hypothetical protein